MVELKKQITQELENVKYTYISHHEIANRKLRYNDNIKKTQILLTAISSCGFWFNFEIFIWSSSQISAIFVTISLGLNLYTSEFKLLDDANRHKNAADKLWLIKSKYESLLVDFEHLKPEAIRSKRDALQRELSEIYATFPGTDEKGYNKAKERYKEYC